MADVDELQSGNEDGRFLASKGGGGEGGPFLLGLTRKTVGDETFYNFQPSGGGWGVLNGQTDGGMDG